jgi:hypothetical protein
MNKTIYEKTLKAQQRNGEYRPACICCSVDDPILLEKHHLHGKAHSDDVVLLCKNHHALITAGQNKLPPRARSQKASRKDQLACLLLNLILILEQIIKTLKDFCYEIVDGVCT